MRLALFLLFLAPLANAKILLKKVDFINEGGRGKIIVEFDENIKSNPELIFQGSVSSILIPDANLEKETEKNVAFASDKIDTTIRALRYQDKAIKIKTAFPFNIEAKKDQVFLTINGNKLIASYPKGAIVIAPKAQADQNVKKVNDVLDESYLNKLLADETKNPEETLPNTALVQNQETNTKSASTKSAPINDSFIKEIKANEAKKAQTKANAVISENSGEKNNTFSMVGYAGKFIAFLGVVLLLFYGVVSLMKKGVFKRSRLGFLHNTEKVEVLSTTYIAPKKSLLLIKAHRQVFLVSNSEAGMTLISEINDVTGLIKDAEKEVAGNNFDDSLFTANYTKDLDSKVKIKNETADNATSGLYAAAVERKDTVKFSDEIKKKVKKLKPLEFN